MTLLDFHPTPPIFMAEKVLNPVSLTKIPVVWIICHLSSQVAILRHTYEIMRKFCLTFQILITVWWKRKGVKVTGFKGVGIDHLRSCSFSLHC